jgi:hypothetical protein
VAVARAQPFAARDGEAPQLLDEDRHAGGEEVPQPPDPLQFAGAPGVDVVAPIYIKLAGSPRGWHH